MHSNGYSLVRKLIADNDIDVETETLDGDKLIDLLLEPTRIYVRQVQSVMEKVDVKAMSHITGGGFIENIPRAIPETLGAEVTTENIRLPKIIGWLMKLGEIDIEEAYNVFNMGIGFILVVDSEDADTAIGHLHSIGEEAVLIGEVTGNKGITIHD